MTINIPLKAVAFVLYTLALLGGAFGISYAVFEWRDDDDDEKDVATESATDEAEKSFSMTLETDEDFKEAARQIGTLMPDFACTGRWDAPSGSLVCEAGLAGFDCTLRTREEGERGSLVFCKDEFPLPEDFPTCTEDEILGTGRRAIVRCVGPSTNAVCEMLWVREQSFSVTCQRA